MENNRQFVATCVKCQAVHEIGVLNDWGRHPKTQGLGPRPVCPELVPSARDPESNEVCRGVLVAQALP